MASVKEDTDESDCEKVWSEWKWPSQEDGH
jgi:hypothetical protein